MSDENRNGTIERAQPSTTVRAWLDNDRTRETLRDALAGWMDPATFAAQCYLAARDPKLGGCSAESMFAAFLRCAEMGLLPSTHHRHVALIPRSGAVDVMPQWQGFKALFEREPEILRTRAVLVHARDSFSIGTDGVPVHTFDPLDPARLFEHPSIASKANPPRDCGLRGGYLVCEFRDSTRAPIYHVVPAHKIHANRLCARQQNVWVQWFEEMCLKTVYRDAWAKRAVPVSIEVGTRMAAADAADNAALENEPNRRGPRAIAAAFGIGEIATHAPSIADPTLACPPELRAAIEACTTVDALRAAWKRVAADTAKGTPERQAAVALIDRRKLELERGPDDSPPTGTDAQSAPQSADAASDAAPAHSDADAVVDAVFEALAVESPTLRDWRAHVAGLTTPQHVAASYAKHVSELGDDAPAALSITLARLAEFASVTAPSVYLETAVAKRARKAA